MGLDTGGGAARLKTAEHKAVHSLHATVQLLYYGNESLFARVRPRTDEMAFSGPSGSPAKTFAAHACFMLYAGNLIFAQTIVSATVSFYSRTLYSSSSHTPRCFKQTVRFVVGSSRLRYTFVLKSL